MLPSNRSQVRTARIDATVRLLTLTIVVVLGLGRAAAAGPRWVTGPPYFTVPPGVPVGWYTMQPLYFTDPGNLSPYVNHAAADAIVAAAASVWNVPTANITLGYGGSLNEHVSGANSYLTQGSLVFPTDVLSGNYAAKQIAVIYDTDGSITDLLLGAGAGAVQECLQNGVTESVDSISPSGHIQHALLVVDGLCTGPAPEQQLQLQYQIMRAFGRVLGLSWSQTNDNVISDNPMPTYNQAMHWPIMHPLDILCGYYTYQCLPQPFTLRDDDIASITQLYLYGYSNWSGWQGGPAPGKIPSYTLAGHVFGAITFPNGQQMEGVNVLAQRQHSNWDTPEGWDDVSSVSGFLYQQDGGNPVTGTGSGLAASIGRPFNLSEGYYDLSWIPMIDSSQVAVGVIVHTEPVNPLYTGTHAVGPYVREQVSPSGSSMSAFVAGLQPNVAGYYAMWANFQASDAVGSCNTTGDGVETATAPIPAGGIWTDTLCGYGHTGWWSFATKPGRTATFEVTALDENGRPTTDKMMPLIGAWGANATTGTLPTMAATPQPFNKATLGTTGVTMATGGPGTAGAGGARFVIADARGGGRPDFVYQARVLYANTVTPTGTSTNGGQITIRGMGFKPGNVVLVNGVSAVVSSLTPSTIVAVAPPQSAFATPPSSAVMVVVQDLSTAGTTAIVGALTYGGVAPDAMTLVTAPSGAIAVGTAAAMPFAVRMTLGDGVTPVVGLPVTFTAAGAAAQLGACGAASCVVATDATGLASTTVTPSASGTVTLQASAVGATATALFNAVTRTLTAVPPVEYVAAGAVVAWTPQVNAVQNGVAASGVDVNWTGAAAMSFSGSSSLVSQLTGGQSGATIGPVTAGATVTGQACAWSGTVCTTFSAVGVAPANFRMALVSGGGQTISLTGTFAPVVVMVTDPAGHPVAGAPVAVHQTVNLAEKACAVRGPCGVTPVLGEATMSAVSDSNGQVTVTPMQMTGVGEVTSVAVASGTQGFVSLTLTQGP